MRKLTELCLALDTVDHDKIMSLLDKVHNNIDILKIGPILHFHDPYYIPDLKEMYPNLKVWLDCKLHDIPHTVSKAVEQIIDVFNADYISVHAEGGTEMMKAAVDAASDKAKILAVTDLSSLSYIHQRIYTNVDLAVKAKVYGIVSSDDPVLRRMFDDGVYTVRPGIRWLNSEMGTSICEYVDDHVRTSTPKQAAASGINCIVVGRPILESDDPVGVCKAINHELYQNYRKE